eukprot:4129368-Prymnesium_polylepis.1
MNGWNEVTTKVNTSAVCPSLLCRRLPPCGSPRNHRHPPVERPHGSTSHVSSELAGSGIQKWTGHVSICISAAPREEVLPA